LSSHSEIINGLVDALRAASVLGRLQGVRRAPFDTRTLIETSGAQAAFVGQGLATPASLLAFGTVSLTWAKSQAMTVTTQELVRVWTAAGETQIHHDLVLAWTAGIDRAFLDLNVGAVPGLNPASITNGITPRMSSGATADVSMSDLQALMAQQIGYGTTVVAAGGDRGPHFRRRRR